MNNVAVPTGVAGELFIPALGQKVRQVEWREDDIYDHVQVEATITAGQRLNYFKDLPKKGLQHLNISTASKVPSQSEMVVFRIGVHVAQATGDTLPTDADIIKFVHDTYLTFKLGERLVLQGPVLKQQTGYGVTGSTTRNGTGVVTLGVPSSAAAPQLLVAQQISEKDDLNCWITFDDNKWLSGGTSQMPTFSVQLVAGVFLHGLIKKPLGT